MKALSTLVLHPAIRALRLVVLVRIMVAEPLLERFKPVAHAHQHWFVTSVPCSAVLMSRAVAEPELHTCVPVMLHMSWACVMDRQQCLQFFDWGR